MKYSKTITSLFFILFIFNKSYTQRSIFQGMTYQQMYEIAFPQHRVNDFIPCLPILSNPVCNYISNDQLAPNAGYDPNNTNMSGSPFSISLINNWSNSHGSPQVTNYGFAYPSGVTNYATMLTDILYSEGIVQKIAPLQINKEYVLSFFEGMLNLNNTSQVDFYIYLIRCNDYSNFNTSADVIPPIPVNSKQIYCEVNMTSSSIFQQKVVKFTADNNYDMIWIFPKQITNVVGLNAVAITKVELIKQEDLTISTTTNVNNQCLKTLSINCLLKDALVTWTSPSGTSSSSNAINVNSNNITETGTWTATVSFPSLNNNNNICSNSFGTLNLSTFVPSCTPCINLPLIQ